MSTSTTPAPWLVTTVNNGPLTNIVVKQAEYPMRTVAIIGVEGLADEAETLANAALIASAPTLLETLIEISERAASDEPFNKDELLEMCSAAFEKLAAEAM